MKAAELRQMSAEERAKALAEQRKKLLDLRCSASLGEDVNTAELKNVRKDIARLMTVMSESAAQGGKA